MTTPSAANPAAPSTPQPPPPSDRSRVRLSAVLIAQDNEATIDAVISNVARVAEEIVVVDGGSRDRTRERAARHEKCLLFERPFDDFAHQKNFAIEQATGRWVLLVDTDELLGARGLGWVRRLVGSRWVRALGIRWFKLRTCHLVHTNGHWRQVVSPQHYPDSHLRLFRNEPFFRYDPARGLVHESFPRHGRGRGVHLPVHVFHYGYALKSRDERERRNELYRSLGEESTDPSMYLWEDHPTVRLVRPKERLPEDGFVDLERLARGLRP